MGVDKNKLSEYINSKVEGFLNNLRSDEINESMSNRMKIYQEFNKTKSVVDKLKDTIDFFLYLKYDELINEMPQESLDVLRKTINALKVEIKNNNSIPNEKRNIYKIAIKEGLKVLMTTTVLTTINITA